MNESYNSKITIFEYKKTFIFTQFWLFDGLSKVVTTDEVRVQDGNLNITAYVSKIDDEVIPSVEEATAALKKALDKAWAAEDALKKLLIEMGIS